MIRTHRAGTLTSADEGAEITLAGWVDRRRDHGGVAFLDLRDASGVVQVVVNDPDVAHGLRDEYCLRIVGKVRRRPEGNENPDIPTGSLEVEASEVGADLAERIETAVRDVTKLRSEVELVAPGSLPNDGKVIEDARSYR